MHNAGGPVRIALPPFLHLTDFKVGPDGTPFAHILATAVLFFRSERVLHTTVRSVVLLPQGFRFMPRMQQAVGIQMKVAETLHRLAIDFLHPSTKGFFRTGRRKVRKVERVVWLITVATPDDIQKFTEMVPQWEMKGEWA